VTAAKLGIELSVAHGVITPVWAPTGIAIAALFLFGTRLWPAVTIGAFLANVTSDASIGVSAAIAIGNTLEDGGSVGSEWLLWWVGDAMGALIVAPLILVWSTAPFRRFEVRKRSTGAAGYALWTFGCEQPVSGL
jgi:integral membrane sensor domain MASE1